MRTTITPLSVPILALLLSACDSGPSSPDEIVSPPPIPTVTYALSGAVSELTPTGPAPIDGALVRDMNSGRTIMTDATGFYSLRGLSATSRSVSVSKFGYVTATNTLTMMGDTQLDIRLARVATYTLSGVVYEITEAGQVPLEGVEHGLYSFAWAMDGVHPLYVTKAGYQIFDPSGRPRDTVTPIVRGDKRFDIQLVRK